jgi:hypothetical protein
MFETSIGSTIDIDAPAERVFSVLTNFPEYPVWSRFIASITGDARVGGRLTVTLDDGAGKPVAFKPTVLALAPDRELRWRGVLGASFVFSGEHYFRLSTLDDGKTRLSHGEIFRGLLVPLLRGQLSTRTRAAFQAFNEALRARVEGHGA